MSTPPTPQSHVEVVRIEVITTREHATRVLTEAVKVLDDLAVLTTNAHAETLSKIHHAHTEAWALLETFTPQGEKEHGNEV